MIIVCDNLLIVVSLVVLTHCRTMQTFEQFLYDSVKAVVNIPVDKIQEDEYHFTSIPVQRFETKSDVGTFILLLKPRFYGKYGGTFGFRIPYIREP